VTRRPRLAELGATARLLLSSRAGRWALVILAILATATVAGMVLLWPGSDRPFEPSVSQDTERAEVVAVASGGCELVTGAECERLTIELQTGPAAGRREGITLTKDEYVPDVDLGDQIRVQNVAAAGIDPGLELDLPDDALGTDPYVFVEFERKLPLLWLALAFAALVVIFGRTRGALSLVGLAVALLIVVRFVVPGILDGRAPLLVALVGAFAVMFSTIPLTHGTGVKSVAAMLGASAALVLTAVLAVAFVHFAHITGLSSEEVTLLRSGTGGDLSPAGLVLAGIVIGALGVLDDVTISQSSVVLALRHARPDERARALYGRAIEVGRDHLGATVNTLVLAYAGAALPVLLIFSTQRTGFASAINRENVAEEVVATLVGSIGLIGALPLTTAIAAALAVRLPADRVPAEGHAH
jgi:uncharacterized membrane protein